MLAAVTQEIWFISAKPLFSSSDGGTHHELSSILSGEGVDESQ
jgi:hypothetical protein